MKKHVVGMNVLMKRKIQSFSFRANNQEAVIQVNKGSSFT